MFICHFTHAKSCSVIYRNGSHWGTYRKTVLQFKTAAELYLHGTYGQVSVADDQRRRVSPDPGTRKWSHAVRSLYRAVNGHTSEDKWVLVRWVQEHHTHRRAFSVILMNRFSFGISGTYGCLFISGNVAHTALAPIEIALLPEVINVTATPPSADCSTGTAATIAISCTIENSSETYLARLKVGAQENAAPTTEGTKIIPLIRKLVNDIKKVRMSCC